MSNSNRFIEQSLDNAFGSALGRDNLGTIVMLIAIVSFGVLYAIARYTALETDIGPLTFVAARFIFASIFMGLTYLIIHYFEEPKEVETPTAEFWIDVAYWGSFVGFFLYAFSIAIQYGEQTQSAAQASFIVGMYVVVIPFCELALSCFTMPFSWHSWVAIAINVPGIILLSGCTEYDCFTDTAWGILILLGAMLCMVGHTLVCSRGVKAVGTRPILIVPVFFSAIVGTLLALIFETGEWAYPYTQFSETWFLIVSSSVAEVLGAVCITVALAYVSTSRAAIVMSIESVSGAIFGYIILGETLTGLEYLGAALMLIAVGVELGPSCVAKDDKKGSEEMVDLSPTPAHPTESSPLLESEERRRQMMTTL